VPPPEEGRPDFFVGAIGTNMVVDAELNAQTCNVGDPLKLTITMAGDVSLGSVFAPPADLFADRLKGFRMLDNGTLTPGTAEDEKGYTYTLRPTVSGTMEIPSFNLAFYDPVDEKYRIVRTRPIPLRVNESATLRESDIIVSPREAGGNLVAGSSATAILPAPLCVSEAGIVHDPITLAPWHTALILISPMLCFLAFVGSRVAAHSRNNAERGLRKKSAREAVAALRKCEKIAAKDAASARGAVTVAIQAYLGGFFGVKGETLTPVDARSILERRGVDSDDADALCNLMQRCFDSEYSDRAGLDEQDLSVDIRRTIDVIQSIRESVQ
jgi:hypothetical protein